MDDCKDAIESQEQAQVAADTAQAAIASENDAEDADKAAEEQLQKTKDNQKNADDEAQQNTQDAADERARDIIDSADGVEPDNKGGETGGGPGGLRKSKRSLYDMIGGDAPAPAGEGVTRTIYPLTENDQTDIDQTDVDEPSGGGGGGASKKKFKHTWANGEHAEEADEGEGEGGHEEGEDEMPEFHDAAANGHVTTLAALYGENSDIIYEADGVGRNALFYACLCDRGGATEIAPAFKKGRC